MSAPNLLLLSGSKYQGTGFLTHAQEAITGLVKPGSYIAFVPYANPGGMGLTEYTELARRVLGQWRYKVRSVHDARDPDARIRGADVIFVGGGNTFQLLDRLQGIGLLDTIRAAVADGKPYIGSSAGSVLAGPDIRTTNDMPIVWPQRLDALGLVPFHINAHFPHADVPAAPNQETRGTRLREFIERNRTQPVLGLEEGSMLLRSGASLQLIGLAPAHLYSFGEEIQHFAPGDDISHLLRSQ